MYQRSNSNATTDREQSFERRANTRALAKRRTNSTKRNLFERFCSFETSFLNGWLAMSLIEDTTSREDGVLRVRSSSHDESNSSESCDCISYSYFLLAFILFAVGSLVTLVVLEEDEFGPMARFWLVGPLFLCFGFLIAIKTLFYLRRKRFIAFIIRERRFAQVSLTIRLSCQTVKYI